jgi:hypothetical protein
MPVELRKIPELQALPAPPVKIRWFVYIFLCIFTGFISTLYFWPRDESTRNLWFWMCAFLIPSAIGVIGYAFRLRHYEQEWERVSYWNKLHDEERLAMTELGQKALGLLGMAYLTPAANNALSAALLQGVAPLQPSYSSGALSVLTLAQLSPPAKECTTDEYSTRLEALLKTTLIALTSELEQYAAKEALRVRVRHDGTLQDNDFLHLWKRIFPDKYTVGEITFGQQDNGLMWLDSWLDKHDAALVLSLEVNLFTEGTDYQTESVSALLLASPLWMKRQSAKPVAWIHRPVDFKNDKNALEDVVRWGKLVPEEKYFIWRSQLPSPSQTEMLQAMDASHYLFNKDREHQLDSSLGKPATAVGHITLICACDHAVYTQQPQWIMLQDKTPQWAIVRPA